MEAKPVEADPDALRFIDVIDGSHLLSEMTPAAQALEQLERLDGSQLKALVEQQDFGGLQHVTSESLLEALGTRAWKKLCAEVLSDVSSFFSYEPATATQSAALVCHMPEYMVRVTFKPKTPKTPKSLKTLKIRLQPIHVPQIPLRREMVLIQLVSINAWPKCCT